MRLLLSIILALGCGAEGPAASTDACGPAPATTRWELHLSHCKLTCGAVPDAGRLRVCELAGGRPFCTDTDSDPVNCGRCGEVCLCNNRLGGTCAASRCSCPP